MSEDFSSVAEFEINFEKNDRVKSGLPIRGVWQLEMFVKVNQEEYIVSTSVDVRVIVVLQECIKNKDKEPLEKLFNL